MEQITIQGFEKAPKWLKNKYREVVNYICQNCHKPEKIVGTLQLHRLKRGNQGGIYTILPLNHPNNNIKVVCRTCHKLIHSYELGVTR